MGKTNLVEALITMPMGHFSDEARRGLIDHRLNGRHDAAPTAPDGLPEQRADSVASGHRRYQRRWQYCRNAAGNLDHVAVSRITTPGELSMEGFQVTYFTEQGRRQDSHGIRGWLTDISKSLGIGSVVVAANGGSRRRDGKLFSAHFTELAHRPPEITTEVTEQQSGALFQKLEQEKANLHYVKIRTKFGVVGEHHH